MLVISYSDIQVTEREKLAQGWQMREQAVLQVFIAGSKRTL